MKRARKEGADGGAGEGAAGPPEAAAPADAVWVVMQVQGGEGEPLTRTSMHGAFRTEAAGRGAFFRLVDENCTYLGKPVELLGLLAYKFKCQNCRAKDGAYYQYAEGEEEEEEEGLDGGGGSETAAPTDECLGGRCCADEAVRRMRAGEEDAERYFEWGDSLLKNEPDGCKWVGETRYHFVLTYSQHDCEYRSISKCHLARLELETA